jgi:hypothetical protein
MTRQVGGEPLQALAVAADAEYRWCNRFRHSKVGVYCPTAQFTDVAVKYVCWTSGKLKPLAPLRGLLRILCLYPLN